MLRKVAAVILIIFIVLLAILAQIGIFGYGFYIVFINFRDEGIVAGIITIFIAGIIVTILEFILGFLLIPFALGLQKTLRGIGDNAR